MINYCVKIALRGVSPMIWRRLRLSGYTTLADLHSIIQVAMGWGDEYLHQFHIEGKDYGISHDGGLQFPDDSHAMALADFGFDQGDRFTYEYNFFDSWLCDIRVESVLVTDVAHKAPVPYCISGQGRWNAHAYYRIDEFFAQCDILNAIIHADDTTTIGDIRRVIEHYNDIRFDRMSVNTQLGEFSLTSSQRLLAGGGSHEIQDPRGDRR